MAKTDFEKVKDQSIQARARGEGATLSLLLWAVRGSELISPWWSKQRDADLRRFWKSVDHLSGAVYTLQSRLITIPFQVLPRDKTIKAHVRQAGEFTDMLVNQSEFGEGWGTFYSKFVEDLVTQDNGSVAEIIGEGRPDGPIIGMPIGVAHLDSWRCTRSGDPDFPIIYQDTDGKRYKLHHTRVLFASQMPSPSATMNGVGLCAVSRCLNIAQNLLDILVYKQEKLGSRPHRNIMVTKGGLDPDTVRSAFIMAESQMNAQQLRRYSKTVVIGHEDLKDAEIQQIDLASLPDGFDERESIVLGMAAIALAFGMDARELFPAMTVGATRAEALIQHMKQRGKGPGQILEMTERLFEYKALPAHLKMVFDYQDDAQDKQVAEIRGKRAERHERDLLSGSVDVRTVREQMVDDGDLTQDQFVAMELEDGRLEDGSDVLTLFMNDDYIDLLDIGVDDPLDVQENDKSEVLLAIEAKRRELWGELNSATPRHRRPVREALAALDKLEDMYGGAPTFEAKPAPSEEIIEPEPEAETEPIVEEEEEIPEDELELKGIAKFIKRFRKPKDPIGRAAQAIEEAAGKVAERSREAVQIQVSDMGQVQPLLGPDTTKELRDTYERINERLDSMADSEQVLAIRNELDSVKQGIVDISQAEGFSLKAVTRILEGLGTALKGIIKLDGLKGEFATLDNRIESLQTLLDQSHEKMDGLQESHKDVVDGQVKAADIADMLAARVLELRPSGIVVEQEVIARDEAGRMKRIKRTYSDGNEIVFALERDESGKVIKAHII